MSPNFSIISKVASSKFGVYLLILFCISIFFLWLLQERDTKKVKKAKKHLKKKKTEKEKRKEKLKKFEP